MTSTPQRYALAALILVALWVVTYWLWPAPGDSRSGPGVTFADAPAQPAPARPERSDPPQRQIDPPTQQPVEPTVETPTDRPVTVAPRFTEYTVQRGDDMAAIAHKVYGDRSRWDAVAKANPTVDPLKLRIGQVLRIAVDPDNIQGLPLGAAPPAPDSTPTEHVVADNETLSGIAQSLYGKSSLWRIIYDANRNLLSTPEDLRPGMRLLIPPAPASAAR